MFQNWKEYISLLQTINEEHHNDILNGARISYLYFKLPVHDPKLNFDWLLARQATVQQVVKENETGFYRPLKTRIATL